MIQIRKSNGETVPIADGCFVELVNDLDKSIGTVFFQRRPGVIAQILPGSSDAARYEQLFQTAFTPQLIHRDLTH